MDPPSKKRSIFGFTGLFRSSTAPAEDRNAKADASNKSNAPAPGQRQANGASAAPHSPVKRASETQMASRKIIGRPQGPSSKLSQSISASEIAHRPSSIVPRRMPGDNPNKPAPSISASNIAHAPSNIIPKSTSFSGVSSAPRSNIFRSSALYSRPAHQTFSPRVPPNTLNQSFPPSTPGRPPRGSTPDVNGRILANTTSTELFKMRIPSPPRHLTGEMLAKEVPNDPNRSGSVYADEFLAHYCPPDLDEHQRRQFFCILDLRRLKYAADEVFTKKDWKINILNFAKEYEKSRSLIMLRYGLYEFKTVRASEAVKKEWKQKHGIPESDEEGEATPRANGAPKRKAEEELAPSNNVFASSVSSPNKRVRAPEQSIKNKRKADAEPDDSQPTKLQKPAPTPSATKSFFESIANNAQSPSTAAKPAGKSLFASSTAKPNGAASRSLFDAPKPASTSNIFGHLSDASKNSGNEGADEDSETSEGEEDESEAQDVSQSDEQAETGGTSTPQFAGTQKATANGTSAASSDAGDNSQSRSLFDRITKGADGQPVKVAPTELFATPATTSRPVSPFKEQPAAAPANPANNTWNAGTPIKFAPPATPAFGSTAAKPPASSTVSFGSDATKADAASAAEAPKEAPAPNIFAAQTKKTEEAAAPATATNGTTSNLFASSTAKSADAPSTAAPIFGGQNTTASTGTPLFGSATPTFGQAKDEGAKDSKPDSAAAFTATPSLFGTQPSAAATEAPKTSLFSFGNNTKTDSAPATQPQFGGLFGKPQTTEAPTEKPASSLFSANATKATGNLFGAASAASSEEPAAKKVAFGGNDAKSGGSLFGSAASTPAPESAETKSLFGASTTPAAPATETKSLFGSTPAATETKSLFGSTPAATETKSLFGSAPANETKSIFGASTTPATPAAETKNLFGAAAPATQTTNLFGSAAPAQESKPLFGGASTEQKPIFGSAPAPTESKPPAGLFANSSAAAPATSTPIFSFGASQTPATSQPAAPPQSGSIFGNAGSSSFTFSAGGSDAATIKNPFSDGTYSAPPSFNFSSDTQSSSAPFTFGGGAAPTISFGGASENNAQQNTSFGGPSSGSIFNFGASSQQSNAPVFSQNPAAAGSIFGNSLAPGGGTSTGTNSPFTFGGASSLATTPAATTPEPSANAAAEDGQGTNADGDDAPQEQISLTDGGPGEEEERAVFEVRAKAVKLVPGAGSDDDDGNDSSSGTGKADNKTTTDKAKKAAAAAKNPWKTMGVGPLRILKHQTTGAVRMLLRAEPRGHVALNKAVLPDFAYKAETKYVKVTTATDDGKGLETWMLQVKTPALAQDLAKALEEHKLANKKK